MPSTKLSITLPPDVLAQVDLRDDNTSGVIAESLDRYYEALRRARASLRPQFSKGECGLVLDVLNGTITSAGTVPLLWASVDDSRADGYGEKWVVDIDGLAARLRALSYIESAALVDGAERWWKRVSDGDQPEEYTELLA